MQVLFDILRCANNGPIRLWSIVFRFVVDKILEEPETEEITIPEIKIDISAGLKNLAMTPSKSNLKRRYDSDVLSGSNSSKRIKIVDTKKKKISTMVNEEGEEVRVIEEEDDEDEMVDPYDFYDAQMTKVEVL